MPLISTLLCKITKSKLLFHPIINDYSLGEGEKIKVNIKVKTKGRTTQATGSAGKSNGGDDSGFDMGFLGAPPSSGRNKTSSSTSSGGFNF